MTVLKNIFTLAFGVLIMSFISCKKENSPLDTLTPKATNYNQNIEWKTIVGIPNQEEKCNHGIADTEGNAVAISYAENHSYIVKIDGYSGEVLWERELNYYFGIGMGLCEIKSSGRIDYLACGGTHDNQKAWIAKLDGNNGSTIWIKEYDLSDNDTEENYDAIRRLMVSTNGYIYGSGFVNGDEAKTIFAVNGGQAVTVKIDPETGELLWKSINSSSEYAYQIVENNNQLYYNSVIHQVGWTISKINKTTGAIEMNKLIPGTSNLIPSDMCVGSNESFYVGGHRPREGQGNPFDYSCCKLDAQGNVIWTKHYANPRGYSTEHIRNELYGIKAIDNDILLIGGSGSETANYDERSSSFPPANTWVAWALTINNEGEIKNSAVYNHTEKAGGNTAGEYAFPFGGGYYLFNDTDANYEKGKSDIGIMKISLN